MEYRIPVSNFTISELNAMHSTVTKALVDAWNAHLANMNNPHNVTKSQVGLGNVDNTSDMNKPVSTAQQAALDKKQNILIADKFITLTPTGDSNNSVKIGTNYTASKDIEITSTGVIQHSNAQIVASTSEYLYPVKYDQYGHAIQVGTGFNPRSKQDTLPGYNFNTKKFVATNSLLHTNASGTPEFISDNLYTGEKGITINSSKAIGHSNTSISPRTTLGLYPFKVDTYGHLSGTSEAWDPSTKQDTLPGYNSTTGRFTQTNKYLHTTNAGALEWVEVQGGGGSSEQGVTWPEPKIDDTFLYLATSDGEPVWEHAQLNGISLVGNHSAEDFNLQTKIGPTNMINNAYITGLKPVAISGSYNDLIDKPTFPTVPTKTSDLTNDGDDGVHPFLTAHQDLSAYATITYVDAHTSNTSMHVTATEKATWNAKQDPISGDGGIQVVANVVSHINEVTGASITGKLSNTSANIISLEYDDNGHINNSSFDIAYIPFTVGADWQYWYSYNGEVAWRTPGTT